MLDKPRRAALTSGGRLFLVAVALGSSLAPSIFAAPPPSPRAEEISARLTAAIDSRLADRLYREIDVGIRIATLEEGKSLYRRDAESLYIPASAAKIFPSAVALARFGPDHQIPTPLMSDARIRDGALDGNLYLVGRGDPSLLASHLDEAAHQLRNAGLRRIRGDLVYDVSYLEGTRSLQAPNARHLYAPTSALTVNSNWLGLGLEDGPPPRLWTIPETSYARLDYEIRVEASDRPGRPSMTYREMPWGDAYTIRGTVTRWDKRFQYLRLGVSRPGLFAATLLCEALARAGVEVDGEIRAGRVVTSARALTTIRTAPLVEAVRVLNQESNNVVAELITQDLGAAFGSVPGSRAKGLEVIREYLLREVGFKKDTFRLADASGLSPENRFSALQLTRALSHFHASLGETFVRTLAPQGHHPHAMAVVPPAGMRIFVKSGTLPATGVNTLVGYIFLEKRGEAYSFALLARRRGAGANLYSGTLTNPLLRAIVDALL